MSLYDWPVTYCSAKRCVVPLDKRRGCCNLKSQHVPCMKSSERRIRIAQDYRRHGCLIQNTPHRLVSACRMKICVIIDFFNSAATNRATLYSGREQDHASVENIVVDGGSSDQTLEIVTTEGVHAAKVVSEYGDGIASR